MYIPKWVAFQDAVSHVCAVGGRYREDAEELLLKAIRDGDIQARDARTGERFPSRMWFAAAINPVHLPAFAPIEVCTADLQSCWPEPSRKTTQKRAPAPTDQELDKWMANVRPYAKRDQTIADCHLATGATVRAVKAAWKRRPDGLKLRQGQKAGPHKTEH